MRRRVGGCRAEPIPGQFRVTRLWAGPEHEPGIAELGGAEPGQHRVGVGQRGHRGGGAGRVIQPPPEPVGQDLGSPGQPVGRHGGQGVLPQAGPEQGARRVRPQCHEVGGIGVHGP